MVIEFSPINECAETQPFVECHGVNLADEMDSETVEQIKQALLTHGLVLFRNQADLTPQCEVDFNRAFGWHDPEQREFVFGFGAPGSGIKVRGGAQIPALPEVSVLGNVLLEDYHGICNTQLQSSLGLTFSGWHADGLHDMFDGMPEMSTMFNPEGWQSTSGGETCFTSGVRALERIAPELRDELLRCVVAYLPYPNDDAPEDSRRVVSAHGFMVDEGTRRTGWAAHASDSAAGLLDFDVELRHADGGGRHRCIRVHPDTGASSLYISPGSAVCLLDLESGEVRHGVDETQRLLSTALLPSALPGVRYDHAWREGDFVAWINTLVLHSATDPSKTDGPRLLHRVRLSTPKTRWRNGRYTSY